MLTLKGTSQRALRLEFSPDSRTLAAGCEDGKIKLLDLRTGKEDIALSAHAARIRCVAFSPDGLLLPPEATTRVLHCATRLLADVW